MQKTMLALGLSLALGTSAFAENEDFNPEFFFGYLGEDFGQSLEKLKFFHIKEIKFNEDLLGNQQEDAITFTFDNNDSLPAAWRGKKISFTRDNCIANMKTTGSNICEYITNQKELDFYRTKQQASEALNLVGGQKAMITEFYADKEKWPDDNTAAGMASADNIQGKYVQEVRVGVNLSGDKQPGVITATLYNKEPVAPELRSKKLSYVPSEKDGAYQWDCVSNIDSQYLPEPCRHVDK